MVCFQFKDSLQKYVLFIVFCYVCTSTDFRSELSLLAFFFLTLLELRRSVSHVSVRKAVENIITTTISVND